MSPPWTPLLSPRAGPARAPLPAASAAGGHCPEPRRQEASFPACSSSVRQGVARGPREQHSLSGPRCGFERRVDSGPAAGGGEWVARLHRICPPPAPWRRGWRALFPAPVSAGTSLPPPLTLPLLWEILRQVTFEQEGLPEWRAAPPHQPGPGCPEGPAGSRIGEGCVPALGSYLTMAGTRLPQLARRPHQRPLLGTQARQVPARRLLQALPPRLAPAGPAAAAGTSLGTASPLKGCFRAAVPASVPSLPSCHPQPSQGGGRPWADEVLPRV